jgi:uncharacterized hydrophobic protein (TIGR00271 family)
MLYLRAFSSQAQAPEAVRALQAVPVLHVVRQPTADGSEALITAELPAVTVDPAIGRLLDVGLPAASISVERANPIGPVEQRRGRWLAHGEDAMVWAEVVEGAGENARLPVRYVVFMAVAGVLAAFAVVLENSVLLVGAMAVSPDLLPVTAACVGFVGRRPRLVGRSLGTLALGLTVSVFTAFLITLFLDAVGYLTTIALPTGTSLILPTGIDLSTIIVAFVAGIAGMIATETKASMAVGVAISVTTIPAAAYTGVAIVVGSHGEPIEGLQMLGVNVLMLLLGGTLALLVQRRLRRRLEPERVSTPRRPPA